MASTEARQALPELVKSMGAKHTASADLLADAVEIGPHRKGGALLLPEVDALEYMQSTERLRERVSQLEESIENLGMALFLGDRLAATSGERLSSEQFLTGIGMEEFVAELPAT
ncbi:MAG: hypothetical protein ACRDK4_00550 [Solirubrobacteraceae bacterium]